MVLRLRRTHSKVRLHWQQLKIPENKVFQRSLNLGFLSYLPTNAGSIPVRNTNGYMHTFVVGVGLLCEF